MTSLRTVFSRGAYRALGVLAISLVRGRLGAAPTPPAAAAAPRPRRGRADTLGRSARSG